MEIGIALKTLIVGILLLCSYFFYIQIKKDSIPNSMGGLIYIAPVLFIVYLVFGGYFLGLIADLFNTELGRTMKLIEVALGFPVLTGFLWFHKKIS